MGNTDTARHAAAEQLRSIIAHHKFAPGERLNLVGHSHGGNAIGFATQEGLGHRADVVVTLGTPVLNAYRPDESQVGLHLNVYSKHDDVQTLPRGAGRMMWAPARNIDASQYANSHSALWQQPGTWDNAVVPNLAGFGVPGTAGIPDVGTASGTYYFADGRTMSVQTADDARQQDHPMIDYSSGYSVGPR